MPDETANNFMAELAAVSVSASTNVAASSIPEDFFSFGSHISQPQVHDELSRYLLMAVDYLPFQMKIDDKLHRLFFKCNMAVP